MEEFLNVLILQCELFWFLVMNRRSHVHADLFNSYFISEIWSPMANFWVFPKGQLHSPNVNHSIFIIFCCKGHWESHSKEFIKTWDGLQKDPQTHRLTNTKTNWWTQKSKNFKRPTLTFVNAGPPDR